jgi:hypothetical protein
MHRSGTSALAGMLSKLGAASPRSLMQADELNAKGYFESVLFWRFHDNLLEAGGSFWDDWRPFDVARLGPALPSFEQEAMRLLWEEFGDSALFVLKDPRICRFAPFWLSLLKKQNIAPRVVIPFRSPLEVAESLRVRNGASIEKWLLLWLRHTLDAERETRQVLRSCVSMDDLIGNWRQTAAEIGRDLEIAWPRPEREAATEIDAFLSPDLKHHAAPDVHQSPARQWVARTYEAMMILTRDPQSRFAQEMIDDVAESVAQAGVLFEREYSDMRAVAHHLQSELTELQARHDPSTAKLPSQHVLAARLEGTSAVADLEALPSLTAETENVRRTLMQLREMLAE